MGSKCNTRGSHRKNWSHQLQHSRKCKLRPWGMKWQRQRPLSSPCTATQHNGHVTTMRQIGRGTVVVSEIVATVDPEQSTELYARMLLPSHFTEYGAEEASGRVVHVPDDDSGK
jgi:hypothetical protein